MEATPTDMMEATQADVATRNNVLLSIERLRVSFGSLVAVRDVSFELRAGDLLGLVGPNGAGKTTLLRAIAGLQAIDAGLVQVIGEKVSNRVTLARRYIGFTPDTPPLCDGLSVRDFLRFVGKGYGLGDEETADRSDFWLERLWLKEKVDQKVKGLSRGMKQRLGIARTLLPGPHVILLDEPAAGLDPAGRAQFRQLLCNLRDQGQALIVSSHILADLNEYCTHIAIMAHGAVVQYGTVAQIATAGDGARCRYTLVLTRPVAEIRDILSQTTGVDRVEIDRDRVVLEYSSDREEAAALLASLVQRRVPIAAFSPHRPDLEEAYLRAGIKQVD